MKHTILISDKFDAKGVARLKEQNNLFEVLYDNGYSREDFLRLLPQAKALVVRSASKVDKEALDKADKLKLIIRAGVGVDNIDIPEASRKGIIVQNTPGGNSISTAEQAIALLFATARKTPQANASVKEGKWEKSKFKGTELTGKTLGIVGLGRIGKEVVVRARGLKMKILGYDPYIPAKNLEHLEIELVSKEEIISRSDFITVHTPLTDSTENFINKENLSKLKDGVALINAARGGIYQEEALCEGLESGKLGAVALDVFTTEPLPENSKFRKFQNCILTPHLGASTEDAEHAVALETIVAINDYFKSGVARNALNFPSLDSDAMDFLKPYFEGGIRIGKLLGEIGKDISQINIHYYGEITRYKVASITSAIQYGVLSSSMGEEVNLVNAPVLTKERGIEVIEKLTKEAKGFASYISIEIQGSQKKKVSLLYSALRSQALIFSLFDLPLEFKPEGIILAIENEDKPGVVGTIGSFLGKQNINIAHLELNRDVKGEKAYCIISIDDLLELSVLEELQKLDNIIQVNQIDLR